MSPETLRRPPVKMMESREPRSIRFCASEWAAIVEASRQRGIEPSTLARDLCLMGLTITQTPALMEAYVRGLAVLRPSYGNGTNV